MRPFLLFVLLTAAAAAAGAFPRLVEPEGGTVWLFSRDDTGVFTAEFPRGSVPRESWLSVGGAVGPAWVELKAAGGQTRLRIPDVRVPGVVTVVRIPRGLRSLVWHGRLPADPVFSRFDLDSPPEAEAQRRVAPGETLVTLPPWSTPAGTTGQLTLGLRKGAPAALTFGGTGRLTVGLTGREGGWTFSPEAWGFTPRTVTVKGSGGLESLKVTVVGPEAPLPADPDTLLAWPADRWRLPNREWFAWAGTPVLVLVTKDYRVQDNYLRRLAFFVEKTGYRGRVVSDRELGGQHGWNAHDYAAPDLAAFFTQAAADGFELLPEERELRDKLVASGILVPGGKTSWTGGTGALVGISAQSPPALRRALFVHEGFHGLYFTSPEFRQGTASAWASLSDGARQAFRTFLARSAYDPSFEALMVNEFQAYVLQRDQTGWEPFFRERVLASEPAGAKKLGQLTELLGAARTLDGLVNTLYGLSSGRISTVTAP